VRSARAIIAIGGSYGTLSEIAYALNLGVPLIGLGTWDVPKIDGDETRMVMVKTPEEAVEEALKKIPNPPSTPNGVSGREPRRGKS
jgi:hypothetical protein